MADLSLTTTVQKGTKQTSVKVSNNSPTVSKSCPDKKSDSTTKKLLLTLMQEVKGLKDQITTHSETSPSTSQSGSSKSAKGKNKILFRPCKHCGFRNHLSEDCYIKPKFSTCGSINHLTKEHPEQIVVKRTMAAYNEA
ncbi:hypothetical protein Tco_1570195 [Tanacetum coccineum]